MEPKQIYVVTCGFGKAISDTNPMLWYDNERRFGKNGSWVNWSCPEKIKYYPENTPNEEILLDYFSYPAHDTTL